MLIFSGDIIGADKALHIGLLNMVFPAEDLLDIAKSLAKKFVAKAPLALGQAKFAINKGIEMDSELAYTFEAETFCTCFTG